VAERRLSWVRALPLLARSVTATMPWTTLISGCLAGTAVLGVVAHFAGRAHWQLDQGAVRYAFLPAVAALAFVPRAQGRPVTQTTPVPAWAGPAGHVLLAVPVLVMTCWAQLSIVADSVPPHSPGHQLAIYPLIAQLTGWCMLAVAAAACVDRSRYADLGGAAAAPVTLVAIALARYVPAASRYLVAPPASARGVTIAWYGIAAVAAAVTCAAARDRWHRYSRCQRSGRNLGARDLAGGGVQPVPHVDRADRDQQARQL
jgi:hypothetical protein